MRLYIHLSNHYVTEAWFTPYADLRSICPEEPDDVQLRKQATVQRTASEPRPYNIRPHSRVLAQASSSNAADVPMIRRLCRKLESLHTLEGGQGKRSSVPCHS